MKKLALMCSLLLLTSAHAQLRYAGSDTVEPLVEAAKVAYQRAHPAFKLASTGMGTSSGMRELCTGRASLVGASRPIKPEETRECGVAGITATEMPVAVDAMVLITSSKQPGPGVLTMVELKRIFAPASAGSLVNWRQLRDDMPDLPMTAVGVDIKHGSFEFFHAAIGNGKFVRADLKATVSHEETAKFVETRPGAIGYVPLSVAIDHGDKVRTVPISFGRGAVVPDTAAVRSGSYAPLTRTVYLYLNMPALAKSESDVEFVRFMVNGLDKFSSFAGLIPLSSDQYQESIKRASLKR